MASKTRLRFLLTILLIIVSIPTAMAISTLFAANHASSLEQRGASVDYGLKGGYRITLHERTDLPTFLHHCGASLNYLSQHYPLTIRLDGKDLTATDLSVFKQIKGEFFLSLRNVKIDEAHFEQLIAIRNLQALRETNTIPESWLARFSQSHSKQLTEHIKDSSSSF